MADPFPVLRPRRRPSTATLLVPAAAVAVSVVYALVVVFGANTTCTDYYSCNDSNCHPCDELSSAVTWYLGGVPLVSAVVAIWSSVALARAWRRNILAAGITSCLALSVAFTWWVSAWLDRVT